MNIRSTGKLIVMKTFRLQSVQLYSTLNNCQHCW